MLNMILYVNRVFDILSRHFNQINGLLQIKHHDITVCLISLLLKIIQLSDVYYLNTMSISATHY